MMDEALTHEEKGNFTTQRNVWAGKVMLCFSRQFTFQHMQKELGDNWSPTATPLGWAPVGLPHSRGAHCSSFHEASYSRRGFK